MKLFRTGRISTSQIYRDLIVGASISKVIEIFSVPQSTMLKITSVKRKTEKTTFYVTMTAFYEIVIKLFQNWQIFNVYKLLELVCWRLHEAK